MMATSNRTTPTLPRCSLSLVYQSKLDYNFKQLKEAVQACTPCTLVKTRDEDGDRTYTLLDGCGDPMGDEFPDLLEVYYLVTNDKDVFNYLAKFN